MSLKAQADSASLNRLYFILIVFGIHVSCGILAYFFSAQEPAAEKNAHLDDRFVFLSANKHPGITAIFGGPNARRVVVRGISSQTIGDLAKIVQDSTSIAKSRSIILLIGADGYGADGSTDDDLQILRDSLPDSIPSIWLAVPPVDNRIHTQTSNQQVAEFNRRIRQLCASKKNCGFVDFSSQMADQSGNLKPEYHTGDGVNFSKSGAEFWFDRFESIVPVE